MSEHTHEYPHTHSDEEYAKLINRISRIIGHATSIRTMLEDKRSCTDILIQISAVQAALNNLGKLILKNHIDECVVHAMAESGDEQERRQTLESLNDAIDKFIR